MLQENVLISFLRKFDQHPFTVVINGKKYQVGEGEPVFTVTFHKDIPLSALTTSTSIALGEAYMNTKDAKAIYKVDKLVLVNCDIFEQYLETFRLYV